MQSTIKTYGNILFDVENKTRKHENQSSWKKTAMVMIEGDIVQYYQWFLERRYGIVLNKPLRGTHVSFINDAFNELNNKSGTNEEKELLWNSVKDKWNGKEIEIVLNVDMQSNTEHWWLMVQHEHRKQMHDIREELGLGKPFFGLHMSIGYANERNIEQSEYINKLILLDECFK